MEGPFDKDPQLTDEQRQVVERFHTVWYRKECFTRPTFLGVRCIKNPFDLWIYQELIYKIRPDLIVETGSFEGGSALYLSAIQQICLGQGTVITIDLRPEWPPSVVGNPHIVTVEGDSTSQEVLDGVAECRRNSKTCMVILDSDHQKGHVLKEMSLYGPFVTEGSYLIVEDGNINGHPVWEGYGPGPLEAIEAFLPHHPEFEPDQDLEQKFLFTFAVKGFLRRV